MRKFDESMLYLNIELDSIIDGKVLKNNNCK